MNMVYRKPHAISHITSAGGTPNLSVQPECLQSLQILFVQLYEKSNTHLRCDATKQCFLPTSKPVSLQILIFSVIGLDVQVKSEPFILTFLNLLSDLVTKLFQKHLLNLFLPVFNTMLVHMIISELNN